MLLLVRVSNAGIKTSGVGTGSLVPKIVNDHNTNMLQPSASTRFISVSAFTGPEHAFHTDYVVFEPCLTGMRGFGIHILHNECIVVVFI